MAWWRTSTTSRKPEDLPEKAHPPPSTSPPIAWPRARKCCWTCGTRPGWRAPPQYQNMRLPHRQRSKCRGSRLERISTGSEESETAPPRRFLLCFGILVTYAAPEDNRRHCQRHEHHLHGDVPADNRRKLSRRQGSVARRAH